MGISELWRKLTGAAPEKRETTEGGPKTDRTRFWTNNWIRSSVRKGLWDDIEKIDRDEIVVARGFDFVTRFAITFSDDLWDDDAAVGFRIESPNQQELDILAPIVRVLQENAFERVRYRVKFGDDFHEVVADPDLRIIANHKLFPYSYQIERNEDRFGRLLAGDPNEAMRLSKPGIAAFDQMDDYGKLLAAFWAVQITQGGFGPKQGLRYCEPLIGPAISSCKRFRSAKDALAIARLTRAWPTKIVPVPMPEGVEPQEAMERIREAADMMGVETTVPYDTDSGNFYVKSTDTPDAVDTTLFYPILYTQDGKMIDAQIKNLPADNPNLNALEDINLMVREIVCALTVPADSLNLSVGQRTFVDKMDPAKREAFLYVARAVQRSDRMVIQSVLDLQLVCHGRNPLKAKYSIVQPRINPREAEISANIDLKRAQTMAIWMKYGIPREVAGNRILQLHPADLEKWVQSEGEIAPEGKSSDQVMGAWQDGVQLALCEPER